MVVGLLPPRLLPPRPTAAWITATPAYCHPCYSHLAYCHPWNTATGLLPPRSTATISIRRGFVDQLEISAPPPLFCDTITYDANDKTYGPMIKLMGQ